MKFQVKEVNLEDVDLSRNIVGREYHTVAKQLVNMKLGCGLQFETDNPKSTKTVVAGVKNAFKRMPESREFNITYRTCTDGSVVLYLTEA